MISEIHQFKDVEASSPKKCDHCDAKLPYSVPSVGRKVAVRNMSLPSQWACPISLWSSYLHTMCCEAQTTKVRHIYTVASYIVIMERT